MFLTSASPPPCTLRSPRFAPCRSFHTYKVATMITRMGAVFPLLVSVVCSTLAAQGQTSVKFDGYLQPRSEMVSDSAVFYLRRARIGLQGQAASWADYRLVTEWRNGTGAASTVSLLAAYGQLTDKPLVFA